MTDNQPTSGDFAYANADRANLSAQDCMVLIGWLSDRVRILEEEFGRLPDSLPELPSSMQGFACYPRRDAAVKEALAKCRA